MKNLLLISLIWGLAVLAAVAQKQKEGQYGEKPLSIELNESANFFSVDKYYKIIPDIIYHSPVNFRVYPPSPQDTITHKGVVYYVLQYPCYGNGCHDASVPQYQQENYQQTLAVLKEQEKSFLDTIARLNLNLEKNLTEVDQLNKQLQQNIKEQQKLQTRINALSNKEDKRKKILTVAVLLKQFKNEKTDIQKERKSLQQRQKDNKDSIAADPSAEELKQLKTSDNIIAQRLENLGNEIEEIDVTLEVLVQQQQTLQGNPIHKDIVDRNKQRPKSEKYISNLFLAIPKAVFDGMKKTDYYSTLCSKGKTMITSGIMVLPFKVRPRFRRITNWTTRENEQIQSNLTTDVSLGPYLGFTWRINHRKEHYFTIPINASLSFINLTDTTVSNTKPEGNTNIVPGITVSSGAVIQLEDFTLGLAIGADWAPGNADRFVYNGRPWFSFSIGHNFLTKKKD